MELGDGGVLVCHPKYTATDGSVKKFCLQLQGELYISLSKYISLSAEIHLCGITLEY